jgi:hypothetical protein
MATLLTLTVVSGVDLGQCSTFDQVRVTLGRDIHNDFVLTDGSVSNWHGEFWRDANNIVYYDLRSRHGTIALIGDTSINLHDINTPQHAQMVSGAELRVGGSRLRLELVVTTDTSPTLPLYDGDPANGHYVTTPHRPLEDWTRGLPHRNPILDILLYFSGRLNSLTTLPEILDLMVQTTFDTFPAANFFAISLLVDQNGQPNADLIEPYWARTRPGSRVNEADGRPILSRSILNRVIETRESVLFVSDRMDTDLSPSASNSQVTACLCAPLVGQRSIIGVVQLDTCGQGSLFSRQDLDLFSVLASNAAFALERVLGA